MNAGIWQTKPCIRRLRLILEDDIQIILGASALSKFTGFADLPAFYFPSKALAHQASIFHSNYTSETRLYAWYRTEYHEQQVYFIKV
ncbi:hypothetical protein SAMN05428977_102433 [Nitrosomonas sp. Nm166]|nr:hypothetical protein SAMN05428977_102433 [Nitrosomonas sp. Nm166]